MIRVLISTFMLIVLGLSLGAEALVSAEPMDPCEVTLGSETLSDHEAIQNPPSERASHHGAEQCPDPCHTGQSHFGHGSFLAMASEFQWNAVDTLQGKNAFIESFHDDPALKRLRRPPRLS
ncbi:MAG: hypothetical protein KF789_06260 [Bdellovibrionaceae bacterium]|nr:hypothetical protein [Pseudobdellovibrionaceae bacterium]